MDKIKIQTDLDKIAGQINIARLKNNNHEVEAILKEASKKLNEYTLKL